jgi:hypothetical protein
VQRLRGSREQAGEAGFGDSNPRKASTLEEHDRQRQALD